MKRANLLAFCLVAVMLACVSPAWVVTPTPAISTATKQILPNPSATNQVAVVTAMQSLNVRVRPGEQSPAIGALYHGDTVTLTGNCKDGWSEIEWQSATAWVNADYLSDNICRE